MKKVEFTMDAVIVTIANSLHAMFSALDVQAQFDAKNERMTQEEADAFGDLESDFMEHYVMLNDSEENDGTFVKTLSERDTALLFVSEMQVIVSSALADFDTFLKRTHYYYTLKQFRDVLRNIMSEL